MIGSDRALGRLISALEEGAPGAVERLEREARDCPRARVIGISGPPGVGKSVLVGRLVEACAEAGRAVGVLAVDPSSPLSGGAILADRLRMALPREGARVYLRSLSSRGALGGLARVVPEAVRALEAAGFDTVLIETVGVGQNEIEIVAVADTVVVVQSPGGGDEVQGLKGGVLEVADVLVLNKCDLAGADQAAQVLQEIARSRSADSWRPPVVRLCALAGEGIGELLGAVEAHRAWRRSSTDSGAVRTDRVQAEILALAREWLAAELASGDLAARVARGALATREAATELLQQTHARHATAPRGSSPPS